MFDSLKTVRNLKGFAPPLNYNNFYYRLLIGFVITVQVAFEETSYLGIPCLTLRKNTERPITISKGTNLLVNLKAIVNKIEKIKKQKLKLINGMVKLQKEF